MKIAILGWEYCVVDTEKIVNSAWSTMEKTYHTSRRRRLIRHRVCVDEKMFKKAEKEELRLAEGWEYATTMAGQFHNIPRMLDLVRRRRWVRRMVTSGTKQSAAIFNLDASIVVNDSKTKTESEGESVTDSIKTETTDGETKDALDDIKQLKEMPEDKTSDLKTSSAEVVVMVEADDKPGQLPEKKKIKQKKSKKKKIKKKKSGISDFFGMSSLGRNIV
ncbi:dysferlin-like isoform X2 [Ciona intestinalis]